MVETVILYNIRSVYNVGSIFRTADAAGVKKIYCCGITPTPLDKFGRTRKDFSKVSLGAEKTVLWEKHGSALKLIGKLKNQTPHGRCRVIAIEQSEKSIPYHVFSRKIRKNDAVILLLGSETKGIPSHLLKKCDAILEIPMRGTVVRQAHHPRHSSHGKESLNVSVAFGIVIYDLNSHAKT